MPAVDISNEQAFLEFCDSIDLSAMKGATFEVGSEVTGTVD
jgi:hypothetical protein